MQSLFKMVQHDNGVAAPTVHNVTEEDAPEVKTQAQPSSHFLSAVRRANRRDQRRVRDDRLIFTVDNGKRVTSVDHKQALRNFRPVRMRVLAVRAGIFNSRRKALQLSAIVLQAIINSTMDSAAVHTRYEKRTRIKAKALLAAAETRFSRKVYW
jgi:hypothetical protein